jgi:antitoxin (DNA-binding transcriptional repressor) of toxin-antitoxin stability system
MRQVNLAEATIHLFDLIDEAVNGETVFIIRDDRQAVQLVPAILPQRRPQFGSAQGLIVMADDFDAPLEDFKEYMA